MVLGLADRDSDPPPPLEERPQLPWMVDQRYRVLGHLGRGGMGDVYRVFDEWTLTTVALKQLHSAASAASLLSEFEVLCGLRHPHVVRPLDFGTGQENSAYFTMELLDGRPLHEACRGLAPEQWAPTFCALADAVAYLHTRGVHHGDIKPSNAWVLNSVGGTSLDGLRLLDFGLSGSPRQGEPGRVTGTLRYMAPERLRGGGTSVAADLYSLGAILFELLHGTAPYAEMDELRLVDEILSGRSPRTPAPDEDRGPLFRVLDELQRRLLAAEPSMRLDDATAVANRVRNAMREFAPGAGRSLGSPTLGGGEFVERLAVGEAFSDAWLAVCTRGAFRALFVEGHSGVGKHRLLTEWARRAQAGGARLLTLPTRTTEYPGLLPRVLESFSRSLQAGGVVDGESESHQRADYAGAAQAGAVGQRDAGQMARLFEQFVGMVQWCARVRPLVIIASDLHAASEEVRHLVLRLASLGSRVPVLLLASFDPISLCAHEDGKPFCDQVVLLSSEGRSAYMVRLPEMDRAEVRSMVSSILGNDVVGAAIAGPLHARSAGLPAAVESGVRHLVEAEVLEYGPDGWNFAPDAERSWESRLPDSLSSSNAWRLRMASAPQDTLLALTALRVGGRAMSLFHVASCAGLSEADAQRALRHPCAASFAHASADSAGAVFWSPRGGPPLRGWLPLVEDQAPALIARSIRWHRRRPRPWIPAARLALARLHDLAGEPLQAALQYSLVAWGRDVTGRGGVAPSARAEAAKSALARLDEGDTDAKLRVGLRRRLAWEAIEESRYGVAVEHLRNARRLLAKQSQQSKQADGAPWVTRARVELGMQEILALSQLGHWEDAQELHHRMGSLLRASADRDERDPEWASWLRRMQARHAYLLARLTMRSGDHARGEALAGAAMEAAARAQDDTCAAESLLLRANARLFSKRFDEGIADATQAKAEFERLDEPALLASAHLALGNAYNTTGQYDQAMEHYEQSRSLYQGLGRVVQAGKTDNNIGVVCFRQGDWQRAGDVWEAYLRAWGRLGNRSESAVGHNNLGLVRMGQGDSERALALLRPAARLARLSGSKRIALGTLSNLAEALTQAGLLQEARLALDESEELAQAVGDQNAQLELWRRNVLWIWRARGAEAGLEEASAAWERASGGENRAERAALASMMAQMCRERGELDTALAWARRANDEAERSDSWLERARCSLDLAEVLSARANFDEAQAWAQDAESLFRRLGNPAAVERAAELAAQRGPAGGEHVEMLTAVLDDLNRWMSGTGDFDQLIRAILARFIEVAKADRGLVLLYDGEGAEPRAVMAAETTGPGGAIADVEHLRYSRNVAANVAETRTSLIVHDAPRHPTLSASLSVVSMRVVGVACVPMIYRDQLIGVIYADCQHSRRAEWVGRKMLLESLGSHAAMVVSSARAYSERNRRSQDMDYLVHELRRPLMAMVSHIDAIRRVVLPADSEPRPSEFSEQFATLHTSVQQMSSMVSDVLALGRTTAHDRADRRRLDVKPWLVEATRLYQSQFDERGVTLRIACDEALPPIAAVPSQLAQVLGNLISNGLRHSLAGAAVEIRAERGRWETLLRPSTDASVSTRLELAAPVLPAPARGKCVIITVSDSGPGVPAEVVDTLFDRGAQYHAAVGRAGGMGIGLFICREIISAHGGAIWVAPPRLGGATFAFALSAG